MEMSGVTPGPLTDSRYFSPVPGPRVPPERAPGELAAFNLRHPFSYDVYFLYRRAATDEQLVQLLKFFKTDSNAKKWFLKS